MIKLYTFSEHVYVYNGHARREGIALNGFILADVSVLPVVFPRVVEAKRFLSSGTCKTAAAAARKAGISRSVFYKYKNSVFPYDERGGRIITLSALLYDSPGVLSKLIAGL